MESDGFIDVDWRTKRNRQGWERREQRDWPRTADGRNYDGHHRTPRADGGGEGLDNFEPMDPLEHRKHHMDNGDFQRWGSFRRLKKPKGGPSNKGLSLLGIIPDITGILSGRIRTDTFDNFSSDLVGIPSQEDLRKVLEQQQRLLNPKWKPGDPLQA